ncbi:hypothetical protein C1O24_19905 [Vibrio diazotrophicus]|nr:hypothetical protein C1O24_19905 [Vibrio diazotrophicus]
MRAVCGMGAAFQQVQQRSGRSNDDVDVVILHLANIRIIQSLCDVSGISQDKAFVNIQNYGNTSALKLCTE